MRFDLRLPIGILFSFFGVLLAGLGLFTPDSVYEKSLGINVNLRWGLVLLLFGVAMLALSLRARRRPR